MNLQVSHAGAPGRQWVDDVNGHEKHEEHEKGMRSCFKSAMGVVPMGITLVLPIRNIGGTPMPRFMK
jgi:hypothetical protein